MFSDVCNAVNLVIRRTHKGQLRLHLEFENDLDNHGYGKDGKEYTSSSNLVKVTAVPGSNAAYDTGMCTTRNCKSSITRSLSASKVLSLSRSPALPHPN